MIFFNELERRLGLTRVARHCKKTEVWREEEEAFPQQWDLMQANKKNFVVKLK